MGMPRRLWIRSWPTCQADLRSLLPQNQKGRDRYQVPPFSCLHFAAPIAGHFTQAPTAACTRSAGTPATSAASRWRSASFVRSKSSIKSWNRLCQFTSAPRCIKTGPQTNSSTIHKHKFAWWTNTANPLQLAMNLTGQFTPGRSVSKRLNRPNLIFQKRGIDKFSPHVQNIDGFLVEAVESQLS